MADPDFDQTRVVMLLELPHLGVRGHKVVEYALALDAVQELTKKLGTPEDLSRWQSAIDKCIGEGLTPVVKLWADAGKSWIEVVGFDVKPRAKA
ncbi:MAG: hypothetical protein ACOYBP_09070 [Microbacteriaceae bacterium]